MNLNRVKIGWSCRELSVEGPISIPGQMYMRISEGIHDPLLATALCIDGGAGQDAVIFCALDIVVMRGGIMDTSIKKAVEKQPEIKPEWVVMNATHTHSSCATTHQPEKSLDGKDIYPAEKWMEFATEQISDAIVEAWNGRNEGGIAYGYGYAVVSHSRRSLYLVDKGANVPLGLTSNGFAVMYGNSREPEFAGYEAGADHFVNLMYTFDASENLTGIICNVPCPSQTSEHFEVLSADFWNEVRIAVKKQYGENVKVLPQCAAAGDLSPRILHYKQAQMRRMELKYGIKYDISKCKAGNEDDVNKALAERYDIAERIMDAVNEVYAWAKKDIRTELPVMHEFKTIDLSRRMITPEEAKAAMEVVDTREFVPTEGLDEAEARKERNRYNSMMNRNKSIVRRFIDQNFNKTIPMRMHVLRIGDVAFGTNRFELYMDFMHRMQARSPFLQTFIIQLAGEEGGSYLPTARASANKGYGSSMYENQVGEEGGCQIVEETLKSLTAFKERDNG